MVPEADADGRPREDGTGRKDAGEAARAWLKANPGAWEGWLDGVTTFDGKPGLDAARASLGL